MLGKAYYLLYIPIMVTLFRFLNSNPALRFANFIGGTRLYMAPEALQRDLTSIVFGDTMVPIIE